MAWQDLREFLDELDRIGELHRVGVEVDPVLEIAEITDRVCKMPGGGSALLFEKVKGNRFPVATNILGSERRVCAALEVAELSDITRRMAELLGAGRSDGEYEAGAILAASAKFAQFRPVTVESGPCQEVVEQVSDLTAYPILTSWPGDGRPDLDGRFITLPLVFSRDPETGSANCGIYLVQVLSSGSVAIGWRPESGGGRHLATYRARGERMPVAIALGGDPAAIFAAMLPLPDSVDEMQFAGFLRRKPLEMVRCLTGDLMVPASSELVIEGYLDPLETVKGGEFGNHTGFYTPARDLPVMRIAHITRRQDPIIPATVVGPPPMEDCHMARGAARLMLPVSRLRLPEIVEIHLPLEGIFHGAAVVSIDKRSPGQGRRVMEALWAEGWLSGSRLLIVVDGDVQASDASRVFWKVLNSVDWERDLVFGGASGNGGLPSGGKLGIDATRKMPGEGVTGAWPAEVAMAETIKKLVTARWRDYGFNG